MKIISINEKEVQITGAKIERVGMYLQDTTPGTLVEHEGRRIKIGKLLTSYTPEAGDAIGSSFIPAPVCVYKYRELKNQPKNKICGVEVDENGVETLESMGLEE